LLGNGVWGIDDAISRTAVTHEQISDGKKDREIEPGGNAARLIHELKTKDLPDFTVFLRVSLLALSTDASRHGAK